MNKYLVVTFLLINTIITFTCVAYEQPQGIEVKGKAAVMVVPDKFSLSFAIINRGKSAIKTKALVDHKTNLVIKAANKLEIKRENIQSARMNLRPIYQKSTVNYSAIEVKQNLKGNKKGRVHLAKNELDKATQPYIFEVTRQITINIDDIASYDLLLEQLVKIGVTNISSLSMSVANKDNYYQKALAKAIILAKEKALKIAGQAGVQLGKLIYLKETSYNAPVVQSRMRMAYTNNSTMHNSNVGTTQIKAEVLATFAIKP
jgi:hypothetical protein